MNNILRKDSIGKGYSFGECCSISDLNGYSFGACCSFGILEGEKC